MSKEIKGKGVEVKAMALQLCKEHPLWSKAKIGRELVKLGHIKHYKYIYPMIARDSYMETEMSEIQKKNWEKLSKDITPLALKHHEAGLKETIPPEIPCNLHQEGAIVRASVCKKCKDRFRCDDFKAYQNAVRKLKKDKFPLIKLAEDVEFKVEETRRPSTPQTVNILAIQQMIYNDLTNKDNEAIDVTEDTD